MGGRGHESNAELGHRVERVCYLSQDGVLATRAVRGDVCQGVHDPVQDTRRLCLRTAVPESSCPGWLLRVVHLLLH